MRTHYPAILAIIVIGATACKKDEPAAPVPIAPAVGTVDLAVDFIHGTQPFDPSAALLDGAGNTIRLTTLKFYVSGILFKDDADQPLAEPGTTLLVDALQPGNSTFLLGDVPPGHIHTMQFTLGLDSTTNYADPTLAPYPLNIPDMHWSWNPTAGYKFLNLEGYVDTNDNGTYEADQDVLVQYHCAQNLAQGVSAPVLRQGGVMAHADVEAGQTVTLGIDVDVQVLLAGTDLLALPVAMGNGPGNQLLMDNLLNAIAAP